MLLESNTATPEGNVYAISLIPAGDQVRIVSAAAAPNGKPITGYTIRYTTDGTEPTATASEYTNPIRRHPQFRAAIMVNGNVVVFAGSRTLAAVGKTSAGGSLLEAASD